ncbi:MAG TPA: UDP-N-acetylmuramoyl-L-alanyl-D-glutamate--2,6-diaminopimelate ligase, partial [Alphaproteobacteria bacterium]|nr:UDP-N-acetylmuramoyl-L-alanyl-D-glutamate--2,6-diaminopimelate ligase [Alphaproteobacteria bacterium]
MKLSNILNDITTINFQDCDIANITLDSRQATNGFLFCAINGHNIDARKFIDSTLENNVTAILADSDTTEDYVEIIQDTQIIYIHDLNSKLSKIADNFYQHPSTKTNIVGITGTNGKTTIAQLVGQWIDLLGFKSATMGTIGNGFYGNLVEAANTTGSAFDIQENIANYAEGNAKCVTMEVSSHGLVQGRIDAVKFDIAAFTNLSQDHLDYHNTMKEYFQAKASLFTDFDTKHKVINIDDEYGKKLVDLIEDNDTII